MFTDKNQMTESLALFLMGQCRHSEVGRKDLRNITAVLSQMTCMKVFSPA